MFGKFKSSFYKKKMIETKTRVINESDESGRVDQKEETYEKKMKRMIFKLIC